MPFMDWLIATDAPTVKIKVAKERRGREKNREKRKRRTDVQSRNQRSMNPRRR
jgi:uncharacterized MAPEG superfamily protein